MLPIRAFKLWLAMFLAFALSACGTTGQVVVKHDTVTLTPQDSLLADCPVEAPPPKDEFLAMTKDEKIKALSAVYNQQTINVGLCNKDKAGLRRWKAEELKRVQGDTK